MSGLASGTKGLFYEPFEVSHTGNHIDNTIYAIIRVRFLDLKNSFMELAMVCMTLLGLPLVSGNDLKFL